MFFIDTCYFEALINPKDRNHKESLKIRECLIDSNQQSVINTTVLVETLNRSVKTNMLAENIFNALKSNHKIIKLSDEDYLKALEVNKGFGNSINYSDCTIIQTMLMMGIKSIVTFDSDFKKVGLFHVISTAGGISYGIPL